MLLSLSWALGTLRWTGSGPAFKNDHLVGETDASGPRFLPGPIAGEGLHVDSCSQVWGFPETAFKLGSSQQAEGSSVAQMKAKSFDHALYDLPFLQRAHLWPRWKQSHLTMPSMTFPSSTASTVESPPLPSLRISLPGPFPFSVPTPPISLQQERRKSFGTTNFSH